MALFNRLPGDERVVNIIITEKQYYDLKMKAKKDKITVSEYVKKLVLENIS